MAVENMSIPAAAQLPAANTDAVATLASGSDGSHWVLSQIRYSYTATPTGGKIVIAWGANSETYYISGAGPGIIDFGQKNFPPDTAVTITLEAGSGAVQGSVYVEARRVGR